jgi:hypothetical protein
LRGDVISFSTMVSSRPETVLSQTSFDQSVQRTAQILAVELRRILLVVFDAFC